MKVGDFKPGDIVKFMEYPGSECEAPSMICHLDGKVGILIKRMTDSIATDWGAIWHVFVGGDMQSICYERWMERI